MAAVNLDFKDIPVVGGIIGWLQENDMDYGIHVTAVALLILYIAFSSSEPLMGASFSIFFKLAPIWLPAMALFIFWWKWMNYVGKAFYLYNGRTLFRIRLPQEVFKSPEAMEFVFTQIHNTQNPDNLWQTYIDGKRPLPMGLEIVSIGGDVRLYVNLNTPKAKEAFVATMYAQYPGIELVEEPVDYAAEIPLGDPDWELMSVHMGKKEDKYGPIKTYVDFGLDKMPDEEEKNDPMTPMLERLGDVTPNERVYVQLIVTPFRRSSFKNGQLMFGKGPDWTEGARARVDELMLRDPVTKGPRKNTEAATDFEGIPRITPGEREDIEAIERNAAKYAYEVGMRFVYFAKRGAFRGSMINPLIRMFAQFDKIGRGSIGVRWRTDFNYMWFSDPFGERVKVLKKQEHKEYKLRLYFPKNLADPPKIMTTEELATMFHLPGRVAVTPTLGRIPSTRSQAPSNLPVGEPPSIS